MPCILSRRFYSISVPNIQCHLCGSQTKSEDFIIDVFQSYYFFILFTHCYIAISKLLIDTISSLTISDTLLEKSDLKFGILPNIKSSRN